MNMKAAKPPLRWMRGKMAGLSAWFVKLREAVMERLRPYLQELSAAASALIKLIRKHPRLKEEVFSWRGCEECLGVVRRYL